MPIKRIISKLFGKDAPAASTTAQPNEAEAQPSPSESEPLLGSQVIIYRELRDQSRLLLHLEAAGQFDVDGSFNRLYLPIERALAEKLGCSQFSDDPLPSYRDGMLEQLKSIEDSPDGRAALSGDLEATARVVEAISKLQAIIKVALTNGDVVVGLGKR